MRNMCRKTHTLIYIYSHRTCSDETERRKEVNERNNFFSFVRSLVLNSLFFRCCRSRLFSIYLFILFVFLFVVNIFFFSAHSVGSYSSFLEHYFFMVYPRAYLVSFLFFFNFTSFISSFYKCFAFILYDFFLLFRFVVCRLSECLNTLEMVRWNFQSSSNESNNRNCYDLFFRIFKEKKCSTLANTNGLTHQTFLHIKVAHKKRIRNMFFLFAGSIGQNLIQIKLCFLRFSRTKEKPFVIILNTMELTFLSFFLLFSNHKTIAASNNERETPR